MASRTRRVQRTSEIWPGFVDALSTLLMVIIFLLVVYMLAQHFLTVTLSGRDEALDRLNRQVGELSELLSLEHKTTADLRLSLAEIKADLESVTATRDDLSARLATALTERDALDLRLEEREEMDRHELRRRRVAKVARLLRIGLMSWDRRIGW